MILSVRMNKMHEKDASTSRRRSNNQAQRWHCLKCDRNTVHRIAKTEFLDEAFLRVLSIPNVERVYQRDHECVQYKTIVHTCMIPKADFIGLRDKLRHLEFREGYLKNHLERSEQKLSKTRKQLRTLARHVAAFVTLSETVSKSVVDPPPENPVSILKRAIRNSTKKAVGWPRETRKTGSAAKRH